MKEEKSTLHSIWDKLKDIALLATAAKKLELDKACVETFAQAQKKIIADVAAYDALKNASTCLMDANEEACLAQVQQVVARTDICGHTVTAIMLINAIPLLQRVYEEKGVALDLMWDTLIDLKCKFRENYDLTGIWGTGAIGWYIRVYGLKIIKLGRLEFEPIGYKWDTPYRGIQKGDPVMNMHIPSTGPMKIEDVLDSFRRAYQFFGYHSPMPVAVASWMMYPPICEEVFKPGSNLKNFYDLFDLVEQYEDPSNHNFWRVFNMEYQEGILSKVPLDTSLRRGVYEFMKSGRHMGVGRCMLLFDGEKVIR